MEFDETVRIRRPVPDVFAFLLDVQDRAIGPDSPVLEMTKTPPGPTRIGTRWRELVRLAPGLRLTMHSRVTAVDPDRLLALRFRGGHMQGDLRYTVTGETGTTLLRQQERMAATGWLRLAGRPLGAALARRLHLRLHEIRMVLESESQD